jgi:hypothetical protein
MLIYTEFRYNMTDKFATPALICFLFDHFVCRTYFSLYVLFAYFFLVFHFVSFYYCAFLLNI